MYRVVWRRSALDEMAALWIDADTTLRESITLAAAEIDSLLADSPNEVGESRPNNRRIAFVPPLGFLFQVNSETHRVIVIHVWSPERHKS
jgi:hypothetical protein